MKMDYVQNFTRWLMVWVILANCSAIATGKQISPKMGDKVQRDTIHIIGHAHMDMNWLWTYSETMQMCNDNLRQVVAFMKEFPDYTMLQSQAAVYNFVERVDPPLFKLIQQYVAEDRLELAGGMWTEGDMNLSSGEAIARSFLLGQRYFQSRFGKIARIGWLPDNFGHISQLPQILNLAGCEYFYFHRTKPYVGTFWWMAPDSSKVLCYANDTYNGNIVPELKDEVTKFSPVYRRILHITGVGDHGGGPTRSNIDMVHRLDKTNGYPAVRFTTAGDFFRRSLKEMEGRPIHIGEMGFIFEGCYSSVAEIKEGNRNCENSLYSSEFFNTLRWLNGDKYPSVELNEIWSTIAFNQFHDILPGSGIYEANREAVARYSEVLRKTKELGNGAFRRMADEIKFQENIGQPVVAFNLQPCVRKTIVEATIYSHDEPVSVKVDTWGTNYYGKNFTPVDKAISTSEVVSEDENFLSVDYNSKYSKESNDFLPTVLVRDASGNKYPAQIVWSKPTPPGFTSKVQFIADEMPAAGYRTFYIDMTKTGDFNSPISFNNNTFETDFFMVRFDMTTGSIISLFDKRTQKEFVREGGKLNTLRISLEDRKGGMKSWVINKMVKQEDVNHVESVKLVEHGPVRACIETVKTWGKSRFIERTYIYRSYPRIDYDLEVHWLETGTDSTDSPMLRAVFPVSIEHSKFYSQVPFDVVERPVDGRINGKEAPACLKHWDAYGIVAEANDGLEVPAQKWVDISDGEVGIALLNKSKYGHSYHHGDLRLTLMRSAGNPDNYPNLGKFNISYSLFPHEGNWLDGGVWIEGEDFNIPVYAAEPPSLALVKAHASRPEEESFFSVDAPGVVLTGLKKGEDSEELIIRLAETAGRSALVTLMVPVEISSARQLNILEWPLEGIEKPLVQGRKIQFQIRAHEIVTLGLIPKHLPTSYNN